MSQDNARSSETGHVLADAFAFTQRRHAEFQEHHRSRPFLCGDWLLFFFASQEKLPVPLFLSHSGYTIHWPSWRKSSSKATAAGMPSRFMRAKLVQSTKLNRLSL